MISIIKVIPRLKDILTGDPTKPPSKSLFEVISTEDDINKVFSGIQNGMSNNATKCTNYLRNWDSYREIWEINKDAFIRRYAKLKPALSTFDADINRYNEVANNTQKEETLTNISFVRLDCSPLKHTLVSHCSAWQNKLTTLLNNNANTDLKSLHDMFTTKIQKLQAPPKDLDHLCDSLNLLTQLQTDLPNIEAQFVPIRDQYQILEKYEVPVKDEEKHLLEVLQPAWVSFQQALLESEKDLQEYKSKFKSDILNAVEDFTKLAITLKDDFSSKGPFAANFGEEKAIKCVEEYRVAVSNSSNTEKNLRKGLAVFKIEQASNKDLESLTLQLDSLDQIWSLTSEWKSVWNVWKTKPFLSLQATEMEETVQQFLKRLGKMGKDVKDRDVFQVLRERINQTKRSVPLLIDLKNPAMRSRHWNKLMEEIGKSFEPASNNFTLEKILDLGLDQYAESITILSADATKELSIESGLIEIENAWKDQLLEIVPYKEERSYFKLRSTDEIFEILEENQVSLSAMKVKREDESETRI